MELLKLGESRKRYQILLGDKGDFIYDMEVALKLFEDKVDLDAFSLGQLESKNWLVEVMQGLQKKQVVEWGTIYVLAGWYGVLPAMMFYAGLNIDKIRSFDLDEKCEKIADHVNKTNCDNQWRFKAITQDVFDINFEEHSWQCWSNKNGRMSYPISDVPQTIINTSCEHMKRDWFDGIPSNRYVILQSNDSFSEVGHINAVADLEDFKSMYPMKSIIYSGEMKFPKYTRYMLIGIK